MSKKSRKQREKLLGLPPSEPVSQKDFIEAKRAARTEQRVIQVGNGHLYGQPPLARSVKQRPRKRG